MYYKFYFIGEKVNHGVGILENKSEDTLKLGPRSSTKMSDESKI